MQLIEAEHGQPIDELLRSLYVDEGLDIEEVGARLGGLSKGTVSRWMARFGIQARRPRDRKAAIA